MATFATLVAGNVLKAVNLGQPLAPGPVLALRLLQNPPPLLIGLVASCCYVLTWEIIYFGTKSDYIEKYQAHMVDKARQAGESEEAIAAKQAEMAKFAQMYRNPLINSAMTFLEPLPVALIMALVSAGVLRRSKKSEVHNGGAHA